MAFGMKRWLGVVALGCALVAVRTLPPTALELPTRRNAPLQAERRLDAIRDEVVRANATLQRLRWAETLIPATLAGGGPTVLRFPEGSAPDHVERVRSHIQRELAGDAPVDVALGVFFEDPRSARYPGAPTDGRLDAHYYFGRRDGRAYCVAVHPLWRMDKEGRILPPRAPGDRSFLGVCALVRMYGIPGPAVQAWLANGGTALAATASPGRGTPLLYRDLVEGVGRRGLLGRKDPTLGYLLSRVDYDRCFAGVAAGCAAVFLRPARTGPGRRGDSSVDPAIPSVAPASAIQASSLFEPADYHVAADLAEEFGRDRFLEWWTADGDVADAFEASFGVDPGAWNLRRIGAFVTVQKPGPGPSEAGLLGGALLVALSTMIAGLWSRRRRVG